MNKLGKRGTQPRRIASEVSLVAAAWVLSLGFDLFLHAGLLARLYRQGSPFLLPPIEAFRRIPLGYASFLIAVLGLLWLFRRLDVRGAGAGVRLGGAVGLTVWGTVALGLYSVSTGSPALLVGWWLGQSAELALAGAVLGARGGGAPLRRIWLLVGFAVVVAVAVTVVLQSLGLAPAVKMP